MKTIATHMKAVTQGRTLLLGASLLFLQGCTVMPGVADPQAAWKHWSHKTWELVRPTGRNEAAQIAHADWQRLCDEHAGLHIAQFLPGYRAGQFTPATRSPLNQPGVPDFLGTLDAKYNVWREVTPKTQPPYEVLLSSVSLWDKATNQKMGEAVRLTVATATSEKPSHECGTDRLDDLLKGMSQVSKD